MLLQTSGQGQDQRVHVLVQQEIKGFLYPGFGAYVSIVSKYLDPLGSLV